MDHEMMHKRQLRVFKNLSKGKEFANQLQALLHSNNNNNNNKAFEDEGLVLAEQLAQKVLISFTKSLSEISQIQDASPSGGLSLQEFDRSKQRPDVKDRRGVYKRRRTADSWVVNSTTTGDGYAWRKYGQKEIQNSNHPRCYFRCTHKYDQGCPAIKQVQKINQENIVYQTTYFGNHTCKDTIKISQMVSDSNESNLISFQGKLPANYNQYIDNPTSAKQESKEETQSGLTHDSNWDLGNTSEPNMMMELSPKIGSFNEEVVSSSLHGDDQLDHMKIFSKFIDFNNHDFNFYDN